MLRPRCWLAGCFGLNGPFRQYFSLYRAVSQRERKREMIEERKYANNPHPHLLQAQQALALLESKLVGRPGTGSLPSIIALPDHAEEYDIYLCSTDNAPSPGFPALSVYHRAGIPRSASETMIDYIFSKDGHKVGWLVV